MASILQSNLVKMLCSCGIYLPITRLYFCKHCLKLRCGRCVSQEVDSHYCPNCLENMPTGEAKLKRNRCPNCLDCPSCKHTLSTRATSVSVPDAPKGTTKKVYYLACGFCRWSSRDADIPDKESASGAWKERDNHHAKRIGELLEFYHQVSNREKIEREKKKYTRRRTYFHIQEKLTATPRGFGRKNSGLSAALSSFNLKEGGQREEFTIKAVQPRDDWQPVAAAVYTEPTVLENVPSITQRFLQPEMSVTAITNLHPRHKNLLIKRSQRCRECEHNLSKPEFNPSSIKFKIQMIALHHIPDIRIFLVPKLHYQRESIVTLLIANPLQNALRIKMVAPAETEDDDKTTAQVVVPGQVLTLAPKDDTTEFDDAATDAKDYDDKMEFVQFRKAHKLGVLVKVTPLQADGDVIMAFILKYDYKHATSSVAEPTVCEDGGDSLWLEHPVMINIGGLAGNQ